MAQEDAQTAPANFASEMHGATMGANAMGSNARAFGLVNNFNYGLSLTEAERLFGLLFDANFPKLAERAAEEARRRVDEFAASFVRQAAAQLVTEPQIDNLGEPDVQFSLNAAIQAVARRGCDELRDILARLIVQRLQTGENEMMSVVLGESVSAAGKLTPRQLHALALCYITMYAEWFESSSITWDEANHFLEHTARPFMSTTIARADLLHLQYAGCCDLARGPVNPFYYVIAHRYKQLFQNDDSEKSVVSHRRGVPDPEGFKQFVKPGWLLFDAAHHRGVRSGNRNYREGDGTAFANR